MILLNHNQKSLFMLLLWVYPTRLLSKIVGLIYNVTSKTIPISLLLKRVLELTVPLASQRHHAAVI